MSKRCCVRTDAKQYMYSVYFNFNTNGGYFLWKKYNEILMPMHTIVDSMVQMASQLEHWHDSFLYIDELVGSYFDNNHNSIFACDGDLEEICHK